MHHVLLAIVVATLGMAIEVQQPEEPLRVLIVTGQDIEAHDWRATAPALRAIIEDRGECQTRIVEDPEALGTDLIFDYDVLVLHFYNERPLRRSAAVRTNLERFVKQEGRGLVLIHFASGALSDWPGYGELAGMVWDGVNTHDPRGPFEVEVVEPAHPVTRDLESFPTDDELYIGLEARRPVAVLAEARSKLTGRDHPMAFAFECGRGRVFHTPLGHDVKALQQPGTAKLLRRGCLWAGNRRN